MISGEMLDFCAYCRNKSENSRMRQAYTGQHGYGPYNTNGNNPNAYGNNSEVDRLGNLKRAIGAIEQRLTGNPMPVQTGYPPVPPYAHSPYMQTPYPQFGSQPADAMAQQGYGNPSNGAELGMLQEQLNRLSNQIAMPQSANMGPAANNIETDMHNIAAQIAQRQQSLNAGAVRQAPVRPTAQTTAPGSSASPFQTPAPDNAGMELIAKHLAGLKKELFELKKQVEKPVSVQQTVSQNEIDRIAGAIAELQKGSRFDEAAFERLDKELEELRSGMKQDISQVVRSEIGARNGNPADELGTHIDARLDTLSEELNSISSKSSSDLGSRIDALNKGLDEISLKSTSAVIPRVDNLATQIDAMRLTVDNLPQTLAISRLEENLTAVMSKMENLINTKSADQGVSSNDISSIEGRLDEISRALVAVSNSATSAASAGPALEVDMSGVDRVEARVSELGRAIDELATKDNDAELQNIAVRIDGLTERLGSFEKYAQSGDLGGASAMFAAPDIGVIEDQLRQLNTRVEEASFNSPSSQLEDQLRQLSLQVEEAANVNSTAAQMSNLEAQIGQIIRQMNKQEGGAPDFAPLESRLGQIEAQLASNQNFPLEAAQQAAQQAVSMMGAQSEPGQIINALSQDLKSLQLAAESGNAQNVQTVENVQQTLEQVVGRLVSIENSISEAPFEAPAARRVEILNDEEIYPDTAQTTDMEQLGVVHQAAVDAGYVANEVAQAGPPQTAEPIQVDAPSLDPSEFIDKGFASTPEDNAPLEPGSAAPDLDRMVEEASVKLNEDTVALTETSTPESLDDARPGDDMRPDAVAAARRALQATTAEMNAVKEEAEAVTEPKSKGLAGRLEKFGGLKSGFDLAKLRKPLIMGAAALLLAIVAFKGIQKFKGSSPSPLAEVESSSEKSSATTLDESNGVIQENNDSVAESQPKGETGTGTDPRVIGESGTPEPSVEMAVTETAVEESESGVSDPQVSQSQDSDPSTVEVMAQETEDNTSGAETPGTPKISEQPTGGETVEVAASPAGETEPTAVAEFEVPQSAGPAALVVAASTGDPKALFQIGMRYSDGNDVKRNMTESARWFERAANKDFAPAQYSIGSLYEKGIGVERDVQKASQWYEKAALQGNARAMHNLAVILAMGNPPEVQPSMDRAVGWFQKAAEFGIKDSQFNLGILYGQGMGVPQNLADSYKWFALAAKTGDSDAAGKRDEVANAMDPNDLDVARKIVNNWSPQKLTEAANRVAVPKEWQGKGAPGSEASLNKSQETVKLAQAGLNQRGFNVGAPDGLIGPKTKRAIMEFQRSAGIPITGRVDKKLIRALDLKI